MSNGAPCGACKFLRRKCVSNCIFAPHFNAEQGAARFAAVHKIFGASNVTKLLHHIPMAKRSDAVLTISYEAQARLSDPVYGCVATIVALQHQIASLQTELINVQMQLSKCMAAIQQQQQQQQHASSFDANSVASAIGGMPCSAAAAANAGGGGGYFYRNKEDICNSSTSPPRLISVSSAHNALKGSRNSHSPSDEDEMSQQQMQFWSGIGPTAIT